MGFFSCSAPVYVAENIFPSNRKPPVGTPALHTTASALLTPLLEPMLQPLQGQGGEKGDKDGDSQGAVLASYTSESLPSEQGNGVREPK